MRARFWGTVVALALPLACASTAFDGRLYRDAQVAFRVSDVPEGWQLLRVTGAQVAYRDAAHNASVLISARCRGAADDVPLAALTGQLVMGTTRREFAKEEVIALDGREAHHTLMTANLDGVRMGYDLFVMKKNGCVYDLAYVAPPEAFDAGVQGFETFARGFRALGAEASPSATGRE